MPWHSPLTVFHRRRVQFPEIDTVTVYPRSTAPARSGNAAGAAAGRLRSGFHPADPERPTDHPAGPDRARPADTDATADRTHDPTSPGADELKARRHMTTAIAQFGWRTA